MKFTLPEEFEKTKNNWRSIALAIGLIIGIAVVINNIGQVVLSATDNYQVYVAEQQGLEGLRDEYERLQKELAYYKSYDYKELYARDNLKLVTPGDKLYQLNTPQQIYSVIDGQKVAIKQEDNFYWWRTLFIVTFANTDPVI